MIFLKPTIDTRNYCIKHGVAPTLLLGYQLNKFVSAFNINRTII
ncbi:hypothetical protein AFEL58S_00705 [Afipia felis]